MRRSLALGMFMLCAGIAYPLATDAQAQPTSCIEEDRGYKLINADGTIDVVRLYGAAVKKFAASNLNGQTSQSLHQFGVTTGDPRQWARLFVMVCKQESNCRIARTYADGSLERFPSTPPNEMSFGPMQFNIGEYGLSSWAMVNSPSCTLEAYIRVAQQGKLFAYFGSMQRPNETLQHANWFHTNVEPFQDALTLVFDPNAPDMRSYQALSPYFVDPRNGQLLGQQQQPSLLNLLGGQQSPFGLQNAMQSNPYAVSPFSAQTAYPVSPVQAGSPTNPTSPTSPTAQPTAPTRSALRLIAQPSAVASGGKTLLSWTSVGMKSGSCRVRSGSTQIADGSEGSRLSTPLSGTTRFVLECTDHASATVASEAEVRVQ